MKVLVTGAGSGLGRFLHRRLGGLGLTRANAEGVLEKARAKRLDLLIHCAGKAGRPKNAEELQALLEDNVGLTEALLSLPHRRFVFLSTVDVYPRSWRRFSEDRPIPAEGLDNVYALSKLMAEALVLERAHKPLILRCASLLGKDARPNAFSRVLAGTREPLTLSGASKMNCVRHEDVAGFIEEAARKDLSGVYNLACAEPVTLSELAAAAGTKPRFGEFRYDAGPIDNAKAAEVWPLLHRPALAAALAHSDGLLKSAR